MTKTRIAIWTGAVALGLTLIACGAPAPKQVDPAANPHAATRTPTASIATTTPPPAPAELTASDIALTVKTTKKDCFGSAGCNVEYKIDAALGKDVAYQECDVTYEVHGLDDTQTGTLNLHTDGTYDQDGYQFGETSTSGKKLTAKIVDIDCDVRR